MLEEETQRGETQETEGTHAFAVFEVAPSAVGVARANGNRQDEAKDHDDDDDDLKGEEGMRETERAVGESTNETNLLHEIAELLK